MPDNKWVPPQVLLAVDLVILTLRDSSLQVLLVRRGVPPFVNVLALPGGFLRDERERLVAAAQRELAEEAAINVDAVHLEELGIYSEPGRDPRGRVVSVAYLVIAPGLPDPVPGTDAAEAHWVQVADALAPTTTLAFDHRQILTDGLETARRKLEHSALATAFVGSPFTISELQQVYEAVWGTQLDPRNFYRKVQKARGFIVPDGPSRKPETGRPARLYRAGPDQFLYPPMVRSPQPTDENPEG